MRTTTSGPASPRPDIDPLDLECHSLRDFLNLIAGVRETHPRDGLRACEDAVLDLVGLV